MLAGINYEQEHRKLWNWLAEHPDRSKADYFRERGFTPSDDPVNDCFACEAAELKEQQHSALAGTVYRMCSYCPLGGELGAKSK